MSKYSLQGTFLWKHLSLIVTIQEKGHQNAHAKNSVERSSMDFSAQPLRNHTCYLHKYLYLAPL